MLVTLPCGCIDHRHSPINDVQQSNVLDCPDLFAEITGAAVRFLFRLGQIVVY